MTVEHRELNLEREYAHPRARVFAAWADPAVKVRWLDLSGVDDPDWHGDFRLGGEETFRTPAGAAPQVSYAGRYSDIVTDERIVMTIEMTVDGRCSSVSLTTVEFEATPIGTRLRLSERTAFLDDLEAPSDRASGVGTQLDQLGRFLDTGPGAET